MNSSESVLLNDEQVRRFIADGYLQLNCGLPAEVHAEIYDKLQWILHEEGNPGNNILPAAPEMQRVLDSPVVRGALESVLGPNYVLHPHRFVHNMEPSERTGDEIRVGKGSGSFVGWHQDSHSPLSRPRHHYPRYAMILYYPQNTPVEMGPTQVIPATQMYARIADEDKARGLQAHGPAGTCTLVHFDIAHGGSMNLADRTRHMAKFVFARVEEPTRPSWNCRAEEWRTPEDHEAPCELPTVWSSVWKWMRGEAARGGEPNGGDSAARDLMAGWEADSFSRLKAIYGLAAMGEPAVALLCADLAEREESRWTEGAVVMENAAYALAALGKSAVSGLTALLEHPAEWVQINALFALGEIGPAARAAVPAIAAKLRHPSHPVVRTALDALGQMQAGNEALREIRRLLLESNPNWQEPLYRKWTGENQVRINAMMALLRTPTPSEALLAAVAESLDDPCGYVGGFGVEILLRYPTPDGMRAALAYLQAHRWDSSLNRGIRTY